MATILILDDRPANRELLVTLLSHAGYTVFEAGSAMEALALVDEARPNLVIADVLMPEIDGFEFVRRIRADPAVAHTRVIFSTAAYLEPEARTLAGACGVNHLLVKPTEPRLILDTVHTALQSDTPAPSAQAAESFERDHRRLVLDKLSHKVDELEAVNAALEERVAARTAELAEANARLHDLNAFKDNLLMITSHDLRSPLGAIQNMAELLLEDAELPDDMRERLVRNIYSSAQHLLDMLGKLLDIAKLEAGKVQLDPIDTRLSELARQALDAVQYSATAKTIATTMIVAPDETPVYVDTMKLLQVLNNLLSNAIKFTPSGGSITVMVQPEPGGMCVRIADTGLGIPTADLPRVFEKFQQIHQRGTADERGSGLGLTIVRQLVELHNGSVSVTSDTECGSTFSVHLPAPAARTA